MWFKTFIFCSLSFSFLIGGMCALFEKTEMVPPSKTDGFSHQRHVATTYIYIYGWLSHPQNWPWGWLTFFFKGLKIKIKNKKMAAKCCNFNSATCRWRKNEWMYHLSLFYIHSFFHNISIINENWEDKK